MLPTTDLAGGFLAGVGFSAIVATAIHYGWTLGMRHARHLEALGIRPSAWPRRPAEPPLTLVTDREVGA